jgi:hypothetical protein
VKRSLPILILTAVAVSTCIGCAAPVRPELKSARRHQVGVDFENLVLFAKHGRRVFFPYSTPRCPYYDRRIGMIRGPGPTCPCGHEVGPAPAVDEHQPAEVVEGPAEVVESKE